MLLARGQAAAAPGATATWWPAARLRRTARSPPQDGGAVVNRRPRDVAEATLDETLSAQRCSPPLLAGLLAGMPTVR
ncbi:MAG: hypothetical protein ACRDTT_03430 [Pseudonocardiaceae bacterium]